jgi:hypothetical protein
MTFAQTHVAEYNWITTEANKGNSFAANCLYGIRRYGKPTDNMLNAVRRNLQPKPVVTGTVVKSEALKEAFDRAYANGLKRPKINFGRFVVSRAPDNGANKNSLYVKQKDEGLYLGKVTGGLFFGTRECTAEVQTEVLALLSSPAETVIAYGKRTGQCAICSRELTDPESVSRGIGPICADRFGF